MCLKPSGSHEGSQCVPCQAHPCLIITSHLEFCPVPTPLWIFGLLLDISKRHSGLLCHFLIDPRWVQFHSHWFWRKGALSGLGGPPPVFSLDPQFQQILVYSHPPPTLFQVCLWQLHPFKGLLVWYLVLLTAYKRRRETLSWGVLRLERGSEHVSRCDDGSRSHVPTACG